MANSNKFRIKHEGKWTRKKSKNGPRAKTKFGYAIVTWCPNCLPSSKGAMVRVRLNQRKAVCANGHTWEILTGLRNNGKVCNG